MGPGVLVVLGFRVGGIEENQTEYRVDNELAHGSVHASRILGFSVLGLVLELGASKSVWRKV